MGDQTHAAGHRATGEHASEAYLASPEIKIKGCIPKAITGLRRVYTAAAAIAAITWLSAKILERTGFWCCFGDDYPLKLIAFHFFSDT